MITNIKKTFFKVYNRIPHLLRYVLVPLVIGVLGAVILLPILYGILSAACWYTKLENALDLKASSPWILVPMYASLGCAAACLLVGSLMYFRKYNRSIRFLKFQKSFKAVFEAERKLQGHKK